MADQIQNGKVVEFSYILHNSQGEKIEESQKGQPLIYLHGHNNIIPGLENELDGMEVGQRKSVTVQPSEAYGEYDEQRVIRVPRENLPDDIEIVTGMQFSAETEQGPIQLWVKDIQDNEVIMDANHPMAGETLRFDVTIESIRDASQQELQHGHVHQGGHDH